MGLLLFEIREMEQRDIEPHTVHFDCVRLFIWEKKYAI